MIAAMNSQTWWWAARSTGIVAWALVTASILWGLTLSSKLIRRRGIPAWLLDLHRYLGTLSVVFTGFHLFALFADSFVNFGPKELFIPFASDYRARAVAWGIAAMYLLLAVQITSRFMQRMPRKVWHTIHLSSFLIFASATIHGALAGADRSNLIVQWLALTGVTWVSFLAIFRLLAPSRRGAGSRVPAGAREQAAAARSAQIGLGDTPIEEAVLTDSVEVAAVRAARASATRDRIPPEARRRAAAVRAGDGSEGDQWAAPKPEDSAQYVKLEG